MEKFVISLKKATTRREHIKKEFGKKKINFVFFDAIDKCSINSFQEKYNISFEESNFTIGEKACFASHVALWDYCFSKKLEYIAVFEDDVLLSKESNLYLKDANWISKDIDLIKIEKFEKYASMSFRKINLPFGSKLRLLQQYHMGTAGYIISYKAAEKLLSKVLNKKQYIHIDQLMFNENIYSKFIDVYQILPALVIQSEFYGFDNLPSQLKNERLNREKNIQPIAINKKPKRTSLRIKKELNRFLLKIKKRLFGKIFFNI